MEEFGAIPAPVRLAPLADRMSLSEGETEIVPGVRMRPAPGHTPGHCIVELASGDARARVLADASHNPIELLEDGWSSPTDVDAVQAERTRSELARELVDRAIPATMTHYGGNRFGRVAVVDGARRWVVVGCGS